LKRASSFFEATRASSGQYFSVSRQIAPYREMDLPGKSGNISADTSGLQIFHSGAMFAALIIQARNGVKSPGLRGK
jgi:hypothetical protein